MVKESLKPNRYMGHKRGFPGKTAFLAGVLSLSPVTGSTQGIESNIKETEKKRNQCNSHRN